MYQNFLHKQVSAWRPTIMSPLLPLSLRYSRLLCRRGDTHSTSCALPNTASASARIPVQSRLCLNLCKLTQVSERAPSNIHRVCSWQTEQQRSHGGKKRREKKLAEKEDWQAWREDWQKEKNRVNTDVCPSHPPFDWAESLSPYSYNSRRETRRPGCCTTPVFLLLSVPPSPIICYSEIKSQLLSYRVVFDFLWRYDTFERSYQFTACGLLRWKTLFFLFFLENNCNHRFTFLQHILAMTQPDTLCLSSGEVMERVTPSSTEC